MDHNTLLLSGSDVAARLSLPQCIRAVEDAFRSHGLKLLPDPEVLGLHLPDGGIHVKTGVFETGVRRFVVVKANANFPHNPTRHRRPTIQGAVLLFDAEHGALLAVMDTAEVTRLRTAAASAVAARYLARPDARALTIVGCGVQGEAHLRALSLVRSLERVWLVDADAGRAERIRDAVDWPFEVTVTRADELAQATRASDMIATCTPSRAPILRAGDVAAGSFVAAVGTDHPEKHEIAPDLMARATIVTDVTRQAAAMGDLRHAISAGAVHRDDVYAELGEVVAGFKPGRRSPDDVIVFDSTGVAFQDAAAAVLALQTTGS